MTTFRTRVPHLITAVLLLLGLMTAASTQAQATPQRLTAGTTICSNSPIPAGWVVTGSYRNNGCAGAGYIYTILDTSNLTNVTVCSNSPIPTNWVITGSYTTSTCEGFGYAYTLAKITTQTTTTVCSFSPLPAGWVVTGSYSTGTCAGSNIAYTIRKV
ncbi:hypothetical protein [Kitasatospora purpeofusca]|uniref:hypothetical protein n=1 Tax=Kitasatospora purpeofusca TaxID=67352 RepID=UPI003256597A|nr:hypothetical protein OIP63_21195 [Kitasatospora purpeofusca]